MPKLAATCKIIQPFKKKKATKLHIFTEILKEIEPAMVDIQEVFWNKGVLKF